jgi:hypothetical protein
LIESNKIEFLFIKIDGSYYNIIEKEYIHTENPFQIKTFSFESNNIPDECSTSLMLIHNHYVHITGLEDEIFIFKKVDFCCYCSQKKIVLSIQSIHLCFKCLTHLESDLNCMLEHP